MQPYETFIAQKSQDTRFYGFEPSDLPGFLYDFQADLVTWALRKGRAAIFADCGLGKTPMQLAWADAIVRRENMPVLILTPLAVGPQTAREAEKFGIEATQSRDGTVHPGITITNYEQLHRFDWQDFAGVVCDESSILKSFQGTTRRAVTRFLAKMPYRLLCTATAAPNDYIELGTSSEAVGDLGYMDMLSRFFARRDKNWFRRQELAARHSQNEALASTIKEWRMKPHAELHFWRWVSSWARACRSPSDLGYDDAAFILPPLHEHREIVTPDRPSDGALFTLEAVGLQEEREERRRTLTQRCEVLAGHLEHNRPGVAWCHLNDEGDLLAKLIPGAIQIKGTMRDEAKLEAYSAFVTGEARVMVTKPVIGAWGLNWQHCADVGTFVSHSYEQYYQSVRRCWRFGQISPVTVNIVATEGERGVAANMARKARAADRMFTQMLAYMHEAQSGHIVHEPTPMEVPSWL